MVFTTKMNSSDQVTGITNVFSEQKRYKNNIVAKQVKFSNDLDKDIKALTKYSRATDISTMSNEKFSKMFSNASLQATEYAGKIKNNTGTVAQFESQQRSANATLLQSASTSKIAATGMKALSMAGNMVIGIFAGIAVQAVFTWVDDLIHKSEKLIEAGINAKSAIESINSDFSSNKKTVDDVGSRYEELSKGVDKFNNNANKTLSTDEYSEFLDVSNQLAEIFPTLVTGYDSQGNALLDLSNGATSATEQLQELLNTERDIANQKIADQLPTAFKGTKAEVGKLSDDIEDLYNKIDEYKNQIDFIKKDDFDSNGLGSFKDGVNKGSIEIDYNLPNSSELQKSIKTTLDAMYVQYNSIEYSRENPDGLQITGMQYAFTLTDEQKSDFNKRIENDNKELVNKYTAESNQAEKLIAIKQAESKKKWAALTPSINSFLQTNSAYTGLNDTLQKGILNAVPQMQKFTAKQIKF